MKEMRRPLVTGGAGFIGNELVRSLLDYGIEVLVFDNFSKKNNLNNIKNEKLTIIRGDCTSRKDLEKIPNDIDVVFHFAADPEVNLSVTNSKSIFDNNILATYNLLERLKTTRCEEIVFASTSTVYGEPTIFPTPETYSPCNPISFYGSSKLACEAMISSNCYTFKKHGIIIRFANIIGPKSDHGIIPDMQKKITKSTKTIEILGDGTQTKSYLYIDDCINGILTIFNKENSLLSTYNLGSETRISVNKIVDIILEETNSNHLQKKFTGGVDGGRGWIGDVKNMLLDIQKMKKLNWLLNLDSEEAVRKTIKQLVKGMTDKDSSLLKL